MTLEARRKNQGKQYTVVDVGSREIIHWHRPGDKLPVYFTEYGQTLTKAVVAEAQKNQRAPLEGHSVPPVDTCEINWKAVGWVVGVLFVVGLCATALTLGA